MLLRDKKLFHVISSLYLDSIRRNEAYIKNQIILHSPKYKSQHKRTHIRRSRRAILKNPQRNHRFPGPEFLVYQKDCHAAKAYHYTSDHSSRVPIMQDSTASDAIEEGDEGPG